MSKPTKRAMARWVGLEPTAFAPVGDAHTPVSASGFTEGADTSVSGSGLPRQYVRLTFRAAGQRKPLTVWARLVSHKGDRWDFEKVDRYGESLDPPHHVFLTDQDVIALAAAVVNRKYAEMEVIGEGFSDE